MLCVLAAAVLLTGTFFIGARWSRRESTPVITSDLLSQQLADIEELATVEYCYTNMGRFENKLDFYGWKVPFTTKRFIVSYDGVIKAGIDLSDVKIDVSGDAVTVTLPQAEILSHEIPEDSIQVFDETRNIFNPISISDYTGFTADQRDEMETRAIEGGLLDRASSRAAETVERLLSCVPGMENRTLTVR